MWESDYLMAKDSTAEAPGHGSSSHNPAADPTRHFEALLRILRRPGLPNTEKYLRLVTAASSTLRSEHSEIRPRDDEGYTGGLVYLADRPTIVIPDLHARMDFFLSVMLHRLSAPKSLHHESLHGTVLEGLHRGELQVVCVGDGFHSEARAVDRWYKALDEYANGYRSHAAMDGEMSESLGLMEMVMTTKIAFPGRFHFLKGNHENISNEQGNGNYAFGKFVREGEMVTSYVKQFLGEDLLAEYYRFEKDLPLLAVGKSFLVSHGEPRELFTRDQVINYRNRPEVVYGLTWTDNGAAAEGSVRRMLDHYLGADAAESGVILGGHRPVPGPFGLRAEGRYVQIHNPERFNIAVVGDNGFDPKKDIVEVPRVSSPP